MYPIVPQTTIIIFVGSSYKTSLEVIGNLHKIVWSGSESRLFSGIFLFWLLGFIVSLKSLVMTEVFDPFWFGRTRHGRFRKTGAVRGRASAGSGLIRPREFP